MVDLDSLNLSSKQQVILGLWLVTVVGIFIVTFMAMGGGTGVQATGDAQTTTRGNGDSTEIGGISTGSSAPSNSFETANGSTKKLSTYTDQTLLLWFPMSDCETCQQQAKLLAENKSRLGNLTIIALPLETQSNSGIEDPESFAREYAPTTLNESNWVWGTASNEMTETYNPKRTHGLGYLVNESSIVIGKGSKPANSVDAISHMANKSQQSVQQGSQ